MSQPTMSDIALEAGVSKNTVSLALRGSPRVSQSTKEHVLSIARKTGYRLNPTVAHLMAELRKSRTVGYQATLGLINAHRDADAFSSHPTIPRYIEGCQQRASELGYTLDTFWMHDSSIRVNRFRTILRARNIRGLLVVGLMEDNRLPKSWDPIWRDLPVVVTGVRTREPALSFTCSDQHAVAIEAFEKALALGYRRPALVLDGVIDRLIEGRFTAGFLTSQSRMLDTASHTRPFTDVADARRDPSLFEKWLEAEQPDVIFTLYHEVRRWLATLGLSVPEDVGLIQYEWRRDHADWAGMDQRNDLVGQAATEMLVSMIHRNECGIPEHPRATMIGSHWVDGKTVRSHPVAV